NGSFADAGEQIAASVAVSSALPLVLSPTVPASAVPGTSIARFRCSSAGGLGPDGPAPDGEVEDHAIAIAGYDHGDAPASYGDAAHLVVPSTTLYLGACVDTEAASQPGVDADLDDANAGTSRVGVCADDEDGITFASPLAACQP